MKKLLFVCMAFALSLAASAQSKMIVTLNNGETQKFNVSEVKSVSFEEESHMVNGHEYVDLGLSVMWATCNVGATTPEGYGDYFAWGETTPKDCYTWFNLKYYSDTTPNRSFTKYVTSSRYGTVDNKETLELTDDAARVNWGGTWRMPTDAELTELRSNCYWEWTTSYNGVSVIGYIVYKAKSDSDKGKKKYSGSSTTTVGSYSLSDIHIFLPAAGYRTISSLYYAGSDGYYWSSSLGESYSDSAWCANFDSDGAYRIGIGSYRYRGRSVRPVCP